MEKAIFLDRDGTINKDKGYVHKAEDFELLPQAAQGLKTMAKLGFRLVIITSQSGIGRGFYTEKDMHRTHDHLKALLGGIKIDAIYFCPHHGEHGIGRYKKDCDCRKPKPGMLLDAQRDLDLDLSKSFMVGDHVRDMEMGKAAGCKTIRIGERCAHADFAARDLLEAARIIKKECGQGKNY
ncbi:MAG: HAD family hydrolase [Nanoarchaeota archaeon]